MEPNNKIIEVKNICKTFGNKKVLQGIDFSLNKGESLVILGGSGTGKSVLIKCIMGLIAPDKGSHINIMGYQNAFSIPNLTEKFGVLFQGGALFDSLPVWANISFGLRQNFGLSKDDAYALAIEKLSLIGLDKSVADLYPAELSGGMVKRVALARAIAGNPEVIFFDEPTAGLDPIMSDVISRLIKKLSKELGATTISITHDMECTRKIADTVAMIHEGKFIWHGPQSKLMDSGNDYVHRFVHGASD